MSFDPYPVYPYDPDPVVNAAWNAAGRWAIRMAELCQCVCPPPAIRVGYSQRINVGDGFSDWEAYVYDTVGTGVAFNTDISLGGEEVQVRARIEITGNGREGVVRYRQVTSHDEGSGFDLNTVYAVGVVQNILIPPTSDVLIVDYEFVACAVGETAIIVGAPARLSGSIGGFRQKAFLKKRGFHQYTSNSPAAVQVYRKETVSGASDPGCALPPPKGRVSRTYSGLQEYNPVAGSAINDWIDDPAGVYNSTLSSNLVDDKHASTPFEKPDQTVDFGVVTYPSPTVKEMIENFDCSGPVAKLLQLTLTNLYATSDLTGAVDAALDAQAALGYSFNLSESDVLPVSVHRQFLSVGEVRYERVRTTQISAGVALGDTGVFIGAGGDFLVTLTCEVVRQTLSPGGGPAAVSTMTFHAKLIGNTGIGPTGAGGRPAHGPDPALGEEVIPPLDNPWEATDFDDSQVYIRNLKIKPHSMISGPIFVEDTSVIDEGYD